MADDAPAQSQGVTILYSAQPPDGSPIRFALLNYIPPLERLIQTATSAIITSEINDGRSGSGVALIGIIVSDPRIYLEIFEENGNPDPVIAYEPRVPDLSNWVTLQQPAIKPLAESLDLDEGDE